MDDNVTVVYMDYDDMVEDHILSPSYQSVNAQFRTPFKFKDKGSRNRFRRSLAKALEPSVEVLYVLDLLYDEASTSNERKRVLERLYAAAPANFNQQPCPQFDYVQRPRMLDHFLWRFTHMSATQRGHNTTATRVLATSDDHKHMRERAYVTQTNAPRQLVRALRALLTDPERLTSKCLDQRLGEAGPRRSDRPGTWEFMSANSLSNPRGADIVVEDDMESFFHLLLFCAVRYLPHNFQGVVPAFMDEYFDGSTYMKSAGQDFCGAAKLSAMTGGRIFFPNTIGCLTFYLPRGYQSNPQEASSNPIATQAATPAQNVLSSSADSSLPRLHPINAVFSRLLRWIYARYALTNEPESLPAGPSEVSAPSVDEANLEPTEEERWFMEEYGMDEEEEEDEEEALNADELSSEQRAAFNKLAAKLKEHKDVLKLFRRSMARSKKFGSWPRRDKVPDQLRSDSDQLGS